MRYVTFVTDDEPRRPQLGIQLEGHVVDLQAASTWAQGAHGLAAEPLPLTMLELLHAGPKAWSYTREIASALNGADIGSIKGSGRVRVAWPEDEVRLLPPLPRPLSLRDFYAFEDHVAAARKVRGLEVPQEWYEFPVFYFSNPHSVFGPEERIPYPKYSQALDYELEVACVIGQPGRDIPPDRAGAFIFGYMIFNDWSARDVQRREMAVGLGPAKGKDFASSLGPAIVTADELDGSSTDRPGVFDLEMVARVNGEERSRGSWNDLHYSFGDMIARASQDVFLLPGEVIGSGTVGTGSLLELTEGQGPWLSPGDEVELEIEGLGVLHNTVGGPA